MRLKWKDLARAALLTLILLHGLPLIGGLRGYLIFLNAAAIPYSLLRTAEMRTVGWYLTYDPPLRILAMIALFYILIFWLIILGVRRLRAPQLRPHEREERSQHAASASQKL